MPLLWATTQIETQLGAKSHPQLETRGVTRVELLGSSEPLHWKIADDGLAIASPRSWPADHAVVFKMRPLGAPRASNKTKGLRRPCHPAGKPEFSLSCARLETQLQSQLQLS